MRRIFMNTKKKVVISGYYGFNNSGDDAILKAIVKELKKADASLEITALSNNPSATEQVYGINAVNRFKTREVIKAIKSCDLFISGGGSLLQDVTSTRSLWYYIALMRFARLCGKPIMVYANGIGPINKKINRMLTRSTLNKVDFITLRDEDSRAFLQELGVANKNIRVTADPVFTLNASEDERVDEIFEIEGIPNDKPLIGISIRSWSNEEKLVDSLSMAIDYMMANYDVNVVLIPMHYPEDLPISNKLLNKVDNERCFVIKDKYSVEDIMGVIKRLEMIIAMRLHSLIYAATQLVPMIGIVYDPKIEGFLKSINMDRMITVENINYTQLINDIDYVWNNRNHFKSVLVEFEERMEQEALTNVSIVMELLNSRWCYG